MEKSTKVAIGLGVATVAGVVATAIVSDKVVTKVRHMSNRRQLRKLVDHSLNGNEKVMNVVNNLSDKDVASVIGVVNKVNTGRDQLVAYGDNVKTATIDAKNKVTDFVQTKF